MTAENGKYTISGEVILGDITITISDTLEGEVSFIDNDDHYKALLTAINCFFLCTSKTKQWRL